MSLVSVSADLTFSGHEPFYCRQFWLKKGSDFVVAGNSFSVADAVVELGVGKNMGTSILYWLKSFNVLDNQQQPSELGKFLFSDEGADPYYINMDSTVLMNDRSSLKSLEQNQVADRRYVSAIYFHTLFLYVINKQRGFRVDQAKDDDSDTPMDLTDDLSAVFSSTYANFLLQFGTRELIEAVG